jgi:uncharacterized protein
MDTGSEGFRTARWFRNAHLQTLAVAAPLFSPPRSFGATPVHEEIPLPEGGSLHARAYWQVGDERKMAVLLVHGLGGTSRSLYVLRAAVALYRAGFHAVCLDLRGVGEGALGAPSLYHAALTEDPRVTADWVASRPNVSGVVLVGFSMGGHVSLRLAGELGGSAGPIRGVVSISAPLDLHSVSRAIERLRSLPYHAYVLRHLVGHARAFARLHPGRARFDVSRLRRVRSVRAFDDFVIAPSFGFADVDDYYRRASAGPFISSIRIPTLVLHAEDDPMVPPFCVRPWLEGAPSVLREEWSGLGGHVGWFGGLREEHWVETWPMRKTREFVECVAKGK